MLNDLKRLFRQSVDAFRSELGRREPEDQVTELLSAMRRELVAARAAIPEFEAEVTRSRSDLAREREALAACERRGELAARIGDAETARVASEFAKRHVGRIAVLEQKVSAAEAELTLRRDEADEMKRRFQHADANRFVLLAQIRSAGAAQRRRADAGAASPFFDFDRMEERIETDAATIDIREELEERERPPPSRAPLDSVEARLQEMKRRMGRQE